MTSDQKFQIFVTLPCDDVCTVRRLTGDTFVYELKSRIEIKTGIPGDIFQLFFMNRGLFDQTTLCEYRIQHGCIVRMKLDRNWADLFEACRRGDIYEVFENGVQFLDQREFEACNIALWNKLVIQRASLALFVACHRGFLGLILELLNRSAADINGKTVFGRTALHAAAYQGFVGCVSLLLSEGAVCSQIDSGGKTPLTLASENGHVYCEKRLWLYQCYLKRPDTQRAAINEQSPREGNTQHVLVPAKGLKPPADREIKQATATLRSSSPNESVKVQDGRVGRKKLHLQLPRVEDAALDSKHLIKTRSVQSTQPNQATLPLVQIVEKYHREFQEYQKQNKNLPPPDGNKQHASGGAPSHVEPRGHLPKEGKTAGKGATSKQELNTGEDHNKQQWGVAALKDPNNNSSKRPKSAHEAKTAPPIGNMSEAARHEEQKIRSVSGKANALRKLSLAMAQDFSRRSDSPDARHDDPITMMAECSGAKASSQELGSSERPEETSCTKPRAVITFDTWLQKKRNRGQLVPRPATAPLKTNRSFGKSIDPEMFKKWLNSKKGSRSRTTSESSGSTQKRAFISTGMTFERWLELKKVKKPEQVLGASRDDSAGKSMRMRVPTVGKSFEDWLQEKNQEMASSREGNQDEKKMGQNGNRTGKPFHVWLQEKGRAKKIELIHKATLENEEERQRELEQFKRWINPHYRTFDEWLQLKNEESVLERIHSARAEPKEREISVREKQEDARVVFDIWLTMKALQEFKEEEKKHEEMKVKWEAEDREREFRERIKRYKT